MSYQTVIEARPMTCCDDGGRVQVLRPSLVTDNDLRPLAELYEANHAPMVRLARLIAGSDALAEEVVQDAFLKVHDRWDEIDNHRAYLRRTVVHGCYDRHRRRRVELKYLPLPPEPVHDPEIDETWQALGLLKPRQRAALVLRFYEDLSFQEIADTLGCRLGTAKSLVHRGLAAMRDILEAEGRGGER